MNPGVGVSLSDDPNYLITVCFSHFSFALSPPLFSLSNCLFLFWLIYFLYVFYVHDEQIFLYFYLKIRTENETLMVIWDRITHNDIYRYIILNILPFLCYLFPLTITFVFFISISIFLLQAYKTAISFSVWTELNFTYCNKITKYNLTCI